MRAARATATPAAMGFAYMTMKQTKAGNARRKTLIAAKSRTSIKTFNGEESNYKTMKDGTCLDVERRVLSS